jgi:heterodisulfide reductase subunit D
MANKDYTFRQLMEISACTDCRICADVCPVVSASRDGGLSAPYRLQGLKGILKSRTGIWRRLLGAKPLTDEQWKLFSEKVFRCTLCGGCQQACPVGIHLKDLWLSLRQDLVQTHAYPEKIDRVRANLEESRNVFGEDGEERAEWVEDMPDAPEHGFLKDRAEVVYFTGCVSAYFPMAQKIPISLAEILHKSGVDFTLLAEEEWCCGFPLLGAGLKEMFAEFREHNLQAVREKGASVIVFSCPSCFRMWQEYYPAEFQIRHETQFLKDLVDSGRIPFKKLDMTVTYHDPCDLGRGAGVLEEPRALIRSIPGIRLVELARNREDCRCCGGGGNLEMVDPGLSAQIAAQKIEEAKATGAQAIVTACQQCMRTMTTHVRRQKESLQVMDVSQLVRMAME